MRSMIISILKKIEFIRSKRLLYNILGRQLVDYPVFLIHGVDHIKSLKQIDDFSLKYSNKEWICHIEGLEFAVAAKNAFALAVTLAVGLSLKDGDTLHYNSQAALFGQSVKEMRGLLSLFGYNEDNIIYGVGDLYVTVFGGRTRKLGTLLGQGHSFKSAMKELSGTTLESVVITQRIGDAVLSQIKAGRAGKNDFPLLLHIYDIITKDADVCVPWDNFTL